MTRYTVLAAFLLVSMLLPASGAAPDGGDASPELISVDEAPQMLGMGAFLVLAVGTLCLVAALAGWAHCAIGRRSAAHAGRLSADEEDAERVVAAFVRDTSPALP